MTVKGLCHNAEHNIPTVIICSILQYQSLISFFTTTVQWHKQFVAHFAM